MAKNCAACDELRNDAPNLIVNGLTNTEIASLKNNTGLNPSSGNDDCTDLNNMNDCLIGNMESEVDAYDVCDWRTFMKEFIGNVWTMFASIIAAICGLWTNVKNLLSRTSKVECMIEKLSEGVTFSVDEESDTNSYVVAGKGVSFLDRSASGSGESSDVSLLYIAGGLVRVGGSLTFHAEDWTDPKAGYHFDNGSTVVKGASRKGNTIWQNTGNMSGDLVYEIRISKNEYPIIRSLYSGIGQEAAGGGFHVEVRTFTEGQYAFGQHGSCRLDNGDPTQEGFDRGHLVPENYIYVQMRMTYIMDLLGNRTERGVTPRAFMGIRLNSAKIEC